LTVFYDIRGKKFLTLTLIKNFSKKGGKDMLALERRNLILEKLQAEKRVVVSELSQLYDVSEETIRRDLDKLEKEGLAIKSYGGAVINEDVSIDLPFNVRKNQNVTGKQKMAELAASLVKDGDHIFLDASTTAVFVAKALKEKERLTVITNSMEILLELADVSGWNIISTGGVMKEGYLAFLGSKTDESIRSYYVDKVIFSCKALDLEWGIMESQEAFGSTKRAMIGSGRKRILVVDSSKFDQTAFSVAGSMKEVDIIVTDKEPTERWKKHFEKFNVKCLYPV
jgi:DeoR/GlpR family transcriptional regulator of sugar metabolism